MREFIYKLTLMHRKLDDEIRSELKRRFPDYIKVMRLKKLRLAVKDRLNRRFRTRIRHPASFTTNAGGF